jgi:glycosyltransferase involved in cell wall biosynthesis
MAINDITFLIKTFRRPQCLNRLIASIRQFYPDARIIVVDDSGYRSSEVWVEKYIEAPFDIGLAAGRNMGVAACETPYIVILDDDFVFTAETDIFALVGALGKGFDIVGGALRENGKIRHYEGYYERTGTDLTIRLGAKGEHDGIALHDFVFNFFAARTKTLCNHPWDDELKLAEHTAFFFAHSPSLTIGYVPNVIVDHEPERDAEYASYRQRGSEYFTRFIDKAGLTKVINEKGEVFTREHIDICITTFDRPECLKRLLLSIAKHYPTGRIYVADQSKQQDKAWYRKLNRELAAAGLLHSPRIAFLPHDCGLSAARNHLMRTTPSRYKLILEDDFVFTPETRIRDMLAIPSPIVGGCVKERGRAMNFEFLFDRGGDTLYHRENDNPWHEGPPRWRETDCVPNFLMIDTQKAFPLWDERLKVCEHMDFFLRNGPAAYSPDVCIDHEPMLTPEYRKNRARMEYLEIMMDSHGLKKIVYRSGLTFTRTSDGIRRSRTYPHVANSS